ncbi:molecular chaperone [Ewingella americana]|uniref:fimbrial biogenesis chaperone n=1 Tax=Ewingella americana TaxID=41202 RepID=UPI00163A1541|nr:molecular chaperone [Ewingella americana]QMV52131.1 molecular chaperone [Ewingella americana]
MWSFRYLVTPVILLLMAANAMAGVEFGGTRVIYNGAKREAAISIKNSEKETPYLIQSWLDNNDDKNSNKVPFIVTPPLFRLDPLGENQLRIVNTEAMPQDRESLYWLNVKSIAASRRDTNRLQISVRTRIKMIYRPAALMKKAADAWKQLQVTRSGDSITFTNPSAYYISFFSVKVGGKELPNPLMVAPFSTYSMRVPDSAVGNVSWSAINDFGGHTEEMSQ